jgi:hypothetical protein
MLSLKTCHELANPLIAPFHDRTLIKQIPVKSSLNSQGARAAIASVVWTLKTGICITQVAGLGLNARGQRPDQSDQSAQKRVTEYEFTVTPEQHAFLQRRIRRRYQANQ